MAIFQVPTFSADSRGNRVEEYQLFKLMNHDTLDQFIFLRGPVEAAWQFQLAGDCVSHEVPVNMAEEWTHAFRFPEPLAPKFCDLAEILKSVLSLTRKDPLDCAIACDWYKIPPDEQHPGWRNTKFGEMVHRGKYYGIGPARVAARRDLLSEILRVLDEHPVYKSCDQIVTVPGHNADGKSFGEQLAARVAKDSGRILIMTQSTAGSRQQAKEAASMIPDGHFVMPGALHGDVIILDDVYRSGTTMSAVAKAAKAAGARRVFGFAPVRTMRN